ncbi:hypothetical protein BSK59_08725 [Paenibacillus odorifer]|uniref:hypothetical protein n=1 Tax=Paenibacillus TaxID=44249 RepID=UPI00096E590D|nr:hypothetical protein [Paenibacillus odorifer]OME58254.1 hypothetical protein BSK59_08725 [Paenibacillus odorifer]
MWMTVGLLSFLASVVLVVMGLIYLIKKKKTKKLFLSALACFAIFIIAVTVDSSNDVETADEPAISANSNGETKTVSTNQDSKNTAAEDATKEAEKKAKEEAKVKAAAEKKAAKEAEEKAQAEADAKAKAEAEEAAKKSQAALIMTQVVTNLTEGASALDDRTREYLVSNFDLFPAVTAETKNKAAAEVDPSITSRHLFKNISPYYAKMIEVSGEVVQISEEETDFGTLAAIHIMNDNGDSIMGIYLNSTGDILDGDYVTFKGVPTAAYSFANVGGGTTNAILLTVSTIQKVQ